MFRKCIAVGIEDIIDIHKGGLLMTRVNLEKRSKKILMAAIGVDGSYKKVKHTLLNFFKGEG